MFARILVPLDGSRLAGQILPSARRLLAPGGELTLLRVVDPLAGAAAEAAAHHQLEQVRDEQSPHDVRASVLVRGGAPSDEIVRASRTPPHDLIAMSTHGRTGVARLTYGSVAESVLRHADVPVLLANPIALERSAGGALKRILVPLDGSPANQAILDLVAPVAKAHGAAVTLLRVEPIVLTDADLPMPVFTPPWNPAAVARTLEPMRAALEAQGVEAVVRAEYGLEVATISMATDGVDLVVMGTHGRSGLLRFLVGSVAEEVVRRVACPVLVQRI